jgi:serine/threonine protein kinase
LHATLALDIVTDMPTYLDTEVIVLETLLSDNIMRIAIPKSGSNQEMLRKVATSPMSAAAVFRELQCLLMVAAVCPTIIRPGTASPRIPKPLGIVRSSDHGGVIGLVETFIPHTHTEESSKEEGKNKGRRNFRTLADMDLTKVGIHRREKWISEIHETITHLHRVGVTWSDVRADNILINSITDEAWLIDFGGGRTDGWAHPDRAGTIGEDPAAVGKVVEYLKLGEQYRLIKKLQGL